jgi:hypothetical protein
MNLPINAYCIPPEEYDVLSPDAPQVGGVWYSIFKYTENAYRRVLVASASVEPYAGASMEASAYDSTGHVMLPHSASGQEVEGAAEEAVPLLSAQQPEAGMSRRPASQPQH